jgi:hypothetical protein
MRDNSVWLFVKVLSVVAYLYIAAAVLCCLPWLFGVRHPASKPTERGLNQEVLRKNGVHAESA